MLNGSIPKGILSLRSLSTILNLSKNSFSGNLAQDIGKLDNLVAIDLSNNLFSGNIPNSISECKSLEKLLMANNKFSGSIPSSLGEVRGLEILDISSNMLSGTIPIELESLRALKLLNLSFNNFEGRIPYGFANTTLVDLQGNQNLGHQNGVGGRKRLILIFTLIGVLILLAVCISVLWMICMRKNQVKDEVLVFSESFKGKHMAVSYNDIRMATENFDQLNLIGRGSFGSVYKGRICKEGQCYAIKVIDMDQTGSMKTFMAECKALKNVRHRNLVKLITACSSTDFKNMDFVALVYELMSNGSLEDWITGKRKHTNGDGLSILERLTVAIDVANAINYLHNECEDQVVHCDLKPNNILLDDDMTAKVADFGLSKLLGCEDPEHSIRLSNTFSLRGSIGYIPPEYGMGQKPGAAGDVYSYGITLLELFTGRGPTDESFVGGLSLKKWVENALESNRVNEVVDCNIVMNMDKLLSEKGECCVSEWRCLNEVLEVGILCTVDSAEARLNIKDVLSKLRNISNTFINS
ncbi:putative receptor-like protein kinase At3g47110 [Impatiens glandulifera]|uniref:putative receptor-like protein kinase At3g47110 n=1 Tax=Impatiens glandulifera TaxID=253017 RepID=UPI001FB0CC01|nr:putative receptor-like protein kinase At3g47110 [Impatiens glandulifera]